MDVLIESQLELYLTSQGIIWTKWTNARPWSDEVKRGRDSDMTYLLVAVWRCHDRLALAWL